MAPHPLANSTAEELAKLPMYYVMDLDKTMPATVAPYMPSPVEVAGCRWLTENDIDVYVTEYERTGFQGALHWYRVQVGRPDLADLQLFAGRRIDVPSMFIAGCSDWAPTSTSSRCASGCRITATWYLPRWRPTSTCIASGRA